MNQATSGDLRRIERRQHRLREGMAAAVDPDALLRIETVEALTGMSRATVYRHIEAGTFPAPLKLGTRCVRWRSSAVRAWLFDPAQTPRSPKIQADS